MKIVWSLLLLFYLNVCDGKQIPHWTKYYTIYRRMNCVDFAKELEQSAIKNKRNYYFIVGYSIKNTPHAFIVIDGWAIDNGHLDQKVFPETDIPKHMKRMWTARTLPEKARLIIVDDKAYLIGKENTK